MIQFYNNICLGYFLIVVQAATYSKVGCFKESSVSSLLTYEDEYQYQSSLHCEETCDSSVIALMDGKYCYCGSTVPIESLEVDEDNCDVVCQGYGDENCGGDGYFLIYADSSALTQVSSSATSTSSSSSSTRTTSSTSTTMGTSSTSSASSSSEQSSSSSSSSSGSTSSNISSNSNSITTSSSLITSSSSSSDSSEATSIMVSTNIRSNSVVTETIYYTNTPSSTSTSSSAASATSSSATASSSSSVSSQNSSSGNRSLSTGGIVGATVGSVAGAALIAGLILFLCYKRKKDTEDRDDEFTLSGPANEKIDIYAGPYYGNPTHGHQREPSKGDHTESYSNITEDAFYFEMEDQNLSSEQGRRRLSNGSLPDMMTRNPGSLKVVN